MRPGGRLYLHESTRWPGRWPTKPPSLEYTYFEEPEPFVDDSDLTYTDADRPLANVAPTSGTTVWARW